MQSFMNNTLQFGQFWGSDVIVTIATFPSMTVYFLSFLYDRDGSFEIGSGINAYEYCIV